MLADSQCFFGPFRLDARKGRLWRDEQMVHLRSKPLAVLTHLVGRAGYVVTKDELLEAVWPNTAVSDGVLKDSIGQIRKALGDTAKTPQFIDTVNRQGYRFIAQVRTLDRSPIFNPRLLVDREQPLAQLDAWFTQALQGERQIGFISGEAGIGKTSLVDAFVTRVKAEQPVWIGHGECNEQYGAGEAYLPLLAALGRLARGTEGLRVVEILRQYAPSWLVQMPGRLPEADFEALQHRESGATRESMLRELAEAVEVLTTEQPLILILEDLHWSDVATLDWLTFVARRHDYARLFVLGTYRRTEVIVHHHPLYAAVRELLLRGQCVEQDLPYLSETGIAAYLTQRFAAQSLPEGLSRLIHQRTNGNPFFMVHVVNELEAQGWTRDKDGIWSLANIQKNIETTIPQHVQQIIESQFERLSQTEQRMLEVASVVGVEFAVDEVAAGLETDEASVDACFAGLARHEVFLRFEGVETSTEGITAIRYSFIHAFYHDMLYERLAPGQRLHLHRRMGVYQEAVYGSRSREIAVELAMHFERGHDYERAVQYRIQAADNAFLRGGYQESINHLKHGLHLLTWLPDRSEKTKHALVLNIKLGKSLTVIQGDASPEVKEFYAQATNLYQQVEDTPHLPSILLGLWQFYNMRGELAAAHEYGQRLLSLAKNHHDRRLRPTALLGLGTTCFFQGELIQSHQYCDESLTLSMVEENHASASIFDIARRRVACLTALALILWTKGFPDQGKMYVDEALQEADQFMHLPSRALALSYTVNMHHIRQEREAVWERVNEVVALADEQGFALWRSIGTMFLGWSLAVYKDRFEQGLELLRQGLDAWQMTGAGLGRPYWLSLLAEVYGQGGQVKNAQDVLANALELAEMSGQHFYTAELYRLQGECLLKQSCPSETLAEACFQQARDIAQQQQAKLFELRATVSLSHLWRQQDKCKEAYHMLEPLYGWFTEGLDTLDLKAAHNLLRAL